MKFMFIIVVVGVIALVFTSRFVQAQIELGRGEVVNLYFQDDYETILECLNSKEWDINEEWNAEDLDAVLLCLDGMGEIIDGDLGVIDEPEENNDYFGEDETEESYNYSGEDESDVSLDDQKAEWECLDPDEWGLTIASSDRYEITFECPDPDEDFSVAPPDYWREEWGIREIIPMISINWDSFRLGDVSDIEFINVFDEFGAVSFWSDDDTDAEHEMGLLLKWIYEHQSMLTDEEIMNEAGVIFAISVDFDTGYCDYWEHGTSSFCQTAIFYMDEILYQQLDDFIWDYVTQ